MYPPTFPQSATPNPIPYGLGADGQNGSIGQLPPWPANPIPYASGPNPYAYATHGLGPIGAGSLPPFSPANFAPQGILGSLLGSAAGGILGNLAGHKSLGRTIGGIGGSFLPFQAGPQLPQQFAPQYPQQFTPQGWGGDLIGQVAQTVGGQLGGPWGQALQGAAPLAQYLPFQAGPQQGLPDPQFDPQGFWSSLKKVVSHIPDVVHAAQTVGQYLPLQAGPQQLGQLPPPDFDPQGFWSSLKKVVSHIPAVLNTAQQVASYLPLQAGPQQQFAPQGWGGDLIGQVAQTVGGQLGGPWGQALQGAAPLAQYLPFQAGPQQLGQLPPPDFDPQGFWSSLRKVVSAIPAVVNTAQQVASYLPLQAGPQQQFAPQGWGGDLINTVARAAGGQLGGPWGQALQAAAPLAQLLPFQAGPQQLGQLPPPDFDPQGFWSSLKKVVSAIPAVVNTAQQVASYLPLQAGPQLAPQWFGPSNLAQIARQFPPLTTFPQSPYQAVGQA